MLYLEPEDLALEANLQEQVLRTAPHSVNTHSILPVTHELSSYQAHFTDECQSGGKVPRAILRLEQVLGSHLGLETQFYFYILIENWYKL